MATGNGIIAGPGETAPRVEEMPAMPHPTILVIARILLAGVFIGLGAERLLGALGIGPGAEMAFSNAALVFSAVELLVGLLLAFGWQVRWLSLSMAAFLLVDAVLAHPFWQHAGAEQHANLLHFLKSLAIIGGLLLLSSIGRPRNIWR